MQREWHFSVPKGYSIVEKSKTMPMAQAQNLLLTKAAGRYTRAHREDDRVTLYSTHLVCPHCCHWVVYNANTVEVQAGIATYSSRRPRPNKARVMAWADPQITFFDEERASLPLAPSVPATTAFICPACGLQSCDTAGERQVDLSLHRGKISLRCSVESVEEILCLQQMKHQRVHLTFPLYEVITFNLRRGRVSLRYEDENGVTLHCRDITEMPRQMVGGATYRVLSCNRRVMRRILGLFRTAWGCPLAYTERMPPVSALVQMTRFVGYPRSFYAAIPYEVGTYRIQSAFRCMARLLRNASILPVIYDRVGLPRAKSLRRLMFQNPGFFFYVFQVSTLSSVLNDVNLTCRFLEGSRAYQVLTDLFARPKIMDYLVDYAHAKSPHRMLSMMEEMWDVMYSQAIEYASMSPEMQRITQFAWSRRGEVAPWGNLPYSVPMHPPARQIPDSEVDGYTFFWLYSSNDYAHAARLLNNCLGQWKSQNAPVVCVRKRDRYVAAIEVRYPYVEQAFARNNDPISHDPPLERAIHAWMERYRLEWGSHVDDDEGVMPF